MRKNRYNSKLKLKDIETNKIYNEIKDLDPSKFKYKNYKRRFYLRMLFLRLYSLYGLENAIKIMMKKYVMLNLQKVIKNVNRNAKMQSIF